MKITVIGAGIVGLSAAWALTRRGHAVTVLDQGPIPNPASASFDQHRMIRPQYGPQTDYTRLLGMALTSWEKLWSDLGVSHFVRTGVLAADLGDRDWMNATVAALRETDTAHDIWSRSRMLARAPFLRLSRAARRSRMSRSIPTGW